MSRRKKIICGVLSVLLICVGVLTAWQWNNIRAVLIFVRFSQEELEEKLAENDQAIKDAVTKLPEIVIRDVTEEERAALRDGTLTQEELVQSLIKQETDTKPDPKPEDEPVKPEKPSEQNQQQTEQKPPDKPQPEKSPEQLAYERELSAIIARVYVLREEFTGRLEALLSQAITEFKAIPKEERTSSRLNSFASGYLSAGLSMEQECDAQIEAIILELETLLQENQEDMSIAQTVYDAYVEEKSLKKAWYMAELKKRGFV